MDILTYEEKIDLWNKTIDSLWWISPISNPNVGQAAPPAEWLRDGLLAYCDGVNWDPMGDGSKGLVRYDIDTASWVYIG